MCYVAQKGIDADSTKLHVLGVAVLPDASDKPFLLTGLSDLDRDQPSPLSPNDATSALSTLLSSPVKKVCYNSKLLYLPLKNDLPTCTQHTHITLLSHCTSFHICLQCAETWSSLLCLT